MEELSAITKARKFIEDAGIDRVPVDIQQLAAAAKATVKIVSNLQDDESGQVFPHKDQHIILVNGNHREERQRFTVLHEIAHIVLNLPSKHHGKKLKIGDLVQYERRPWEEILCDTFAAECLLPHKYFSKDVSDIDISLGAVKELSEKYRASITSTGSRLAFNAIVPCAFVLIEGGKVLYVSRSKYLRELNGWIESKVPVPSGSVAQRLIQSSTRTEDYDEIATNIWFDDKVQGYHLIAEESMILRRWDQCLSLIWFNEELRSSSQANICDIDDERPLLNELDGILPWPSK